mgnify:CR=1 FL=1
MSNHIIVKKPCFNHSRHTLEFRIRVKAPVSDPDPTKEKQGQTVHRTGVMEKWEGKKYIEKNMASNVFSKEDSLNIIFEDLSI